MGRRKGKQNQRTNSHARTQRADQHKGARKPTGTPGGPGVCESLEGRVLLSKARVVDAGDFYWDIDQKVAMLRGTDQVVVGFVPSSTQRMRRLTQALISPQGPLAGYSVRDKLGSYGVLLRRTARGFSPEYDALVQRTTGFPAVKYIGPTFFQVPTMGLLIVTDEIMFDLRDDVDPVSFFGSGYSGRVPGPQGVNSWVATLSNGGGLSAVAASIAAHGDARAQYAIPSFYAEAIPLAQHGQEAARVFSNQAI